jgi:hypothetical protein
LAGLKFDIIEPEPVPGINVVFANSTLPPNTEPFNTLGALTLDFTVDGSGNVTLDASTTSTNTPTIDAVDAWDGFVGFITNASAFGSSFSMLMEDVNGYGPLGEPGGVLPGNLKLTDTGGGGLGVGGLNAWRVDRNGEEAIKLTATSVPVAGIVKVTSVGWVSRVTAEAEIVLNAPLVSLTNALTSVAGTLNIEGEEVVLNAGQELSFTTPVTGVDGRGYALAGFSFDIIPGGAIVPPADLVVSAGSGVVLLQWTGVIGQTYNVQYKDALTDSAWTPDAANQNIPGAVNMSTTSATAVDERFYQIETE